MPSGGVPPFIRSVQNCRSFDQICQKVNNMGWMDPILTYCHMMSKNDTCLALALIELSSFKASPQSLLRLIMRQNSLCDSLAKLTAPYELCGKLANLISRNNEQTQAELITLSYVA